MMNSRTVHGKLLVILFLCFTIIFQLEAAPRNGTAIIHLDNGGGNACTGNTSSAILDIPAQTFSASGNCKENGVGPDIAFSISATFTSPAAGTGNLTGILTQNINGGGNFNFNGSILEIANNQFGLSFNGFLPEIWSISGPFNALSCTKDGITKNPTEIATFYNVQTDSASCANHSQVQTCDNETEFDGDASYQFASCSVVAAEPIPTLSQWSILSLIFLFSVTVYFKGIKQS